MGMNAVQFDKAIHSSHDVLSPRGLRLLLDALADTRPRGLTWFATQCSSFGPLCAGACRNAGNGWLGDTSRAFVRDGNAQMEVTSLVFFLSWLCECEPVLEQPATSVLPKLQPLSTVLEFTAASRTRCFLGQFGAASAKPLQLWHVGEVWGALKTTKPKGLTPLTRARIGPDGRRKTDGLKAAMKQSQEYPVEFAAFVAQLNWRNMHQA